MARFVPELAAARWLFWARKQLSTLGLQGRCAVVGRARSGCGSLPAVAEPRADLNIDGRLCDRLCAALQAKDDAIVGAVLVLMFNGEPALDLAFARLVRLAVTGGFGAC